MPYRSEKRLYLTADRTRVVEEGDSDAAYLLVSEGGEISDQEAKQYGLTGKAKAEPKDADASEADTKAISAPPENKARVIKAGGGV